MLNGPCQPLNAAYLVVPSHFHFTITSPTVDLGNLRRVAMSLTELLLMWQPKTSQCSKSLNSPDLPMLLVLLRNEQHSFLPPFIPVSAVVLTYRHQFTTTGGCPDTFDTIAYIQWPANFSMYSEHWESVSTTAILIFCQVRSKLLKVKLVLFLAN
jgi:hypothetical protein